MRDTTPRMAECANGRAEDRKQTERPTSMSGLTTIVVVAITLTTMALCLDGLKTGGRWVGPAEHDEGVLYVPASNFTVERRLNEQPSVDFTSASRVGGVALAWDARMASKLNAGVGVLCMCQGRFAPGTPAPHRQR